MGLDSASRERDPTATAVQINVFKRQQTPVNVNNLLSFTSVYFPNRDFSMGYKLIQIKKSPRSQNPSLTSPE
jgi:hypothetical protein